MRIAHCQLESRYGDFEGNLAKVVRGLERADRERADIVSFPECFLTGYPDTEELARRNAFAVNSGEMMTVLGKTAAYEAAFMVGFNETRGADLFNTVAVVHKGHLLGTFSKCSAYQRFHKQGREFPVFEHKGVKFGVVICSDGGYPEPSRILALKGARVIFAPHFNYIGKEGLIGHFQHVRADHTARAVENRVYFVRGNNVCLKRDESIRADGVGYGDSYIMDPLGEIAVRSRRHVEDFISIDVDLSLTEDRSWGVGRNRWSAQQFGKLLLEAAGDG